MSIIKKGRFFQSIKRVTFANSAHAQREFSEFIKGTVFGHLRAPVK